MPRDRHHPDACPAQSCGTGFQPVSCAIRRQSPREIDFHLVSIPERRDSDRTIPLSALSNRQRAVAESHIPLVHHALRMFDLHGPKHRTGYSDLAQEACLALTEAVRNHAPHRHGAFGPYAVARIHFAVSQYLHENVSLVRVPYIAQRRRKARRCGTGLQPVSESLAPAGRMRADPREPRRSPRRADHDDSPVTLFPMPRAVSLRANQAYISKTDPRALFVDPVERRADGLTLGELFRARYERALSDVTAELDRASQQQSDHRRPTSNRVGPVSNRSSGAQSLLDRCRDERWRIPDPESQTPIRRLARELHCSLGRITHTESRFRRRMAEALSADPVTWKLRQMSRNQRAGWDYQPTDPELQSIIDLEKTAASA